MRNPKAELRGCSKRPLIGTAVALYTLADRLPGLAVVEFAPDGTLAVGGANAITYLWRVSSGKS